MASAREPQAYAASVNPPRKAKRPRTDAEPAAAPSSSSQAAAQQSRQRPPILPRDTFGSTGGSPGEHDSTDEEDEYDPVEPVPAPKRRGRKPGPLSRSARESQRKLNHSRIEKARRTKINETLATLSNIVNEAEKQRVASGKAPAPAEEKGKGEKEFKLDVLVKTVTYIQELMDKVKSLEARPCERCAGTSHSPPQPAPASPPESPTLSRKRKASDVDVEILEVADEADDEAEAESPRLAAHPARNTALPSPPSRAQSKAPSQSPCLPPISAWLPNPYVDPSCLGALPEPAAGGAPSHLPTPPLSGSFRVPLALAAAPPALMLPGPAHPTMLADAGAGGSGNKAMRIVMPRRRGSAAGVMASPTVSPSWTPEDETAASLLLQMSSSPSASSTSSARARGSSLESNGSASYARSERTPAMQAETPSSLLGLGRHG